MRAGLASVMDGRCQDGREVGGSATVFEAVNWALTCVGELLFPRLQFREEIV